MPKQILVVDDDVNLRRMLVLRLHSAGYEVAEAECGEDACSLLGAYTPDMVITDLRMPGMNGHELMHRVHLRLPGTPVIILTAHGEIPDAVHATRSGAAEFLTKPVGNELLDRLAQHFQSCGDEDALASFGIVTRSPAMRQVLRDAGRVARLGSAVLICGSSGTGKELLARGIHQSSSRAGRPLVAINCAAVPSDLLESELFGHRKGAFTGAAHDHPGLMRSADKGTLFLDEIGDMPIALQSKLLRVLQEREVRPVGDVRAVPVDVRVISATHRNLSKCVENGSFREDLYYRLNVVELNLPALCERREDVPLLVSQHLALMFEQGMPRRSFSSSAMDVLISAAWPGNVRQLFNVVEQTAVLSERRVIDEASVLRALGGQESNFRTLDRARHEFTREYLRSTLILAEGNVSRAARLSGRNRTDFYKLMTRYQVDATATD